MKAKAWLLMLSIMVIGFTGFGFTTSDLSHDSEANATFTHNVSVDLESVESLFEVHEHYSTALARGITFEPIDPIVSKSNVQFMHTENPNSRIPKNTLRKARDGLSYTT